jgi:hypothetical protein
MTLKFNQRKFTCGNRNLRLYHSNESQARASFILQVASTCEEIRIARVKRVPQANASQRQIVVQTRGKFKLVCISGLELNS